MFPTLFLLTSLHAFYKKLYIYGTSWFCLAITTYLWHNGYEWVLVYDRLLILMIIIYGLYYYINSEKYSILIPITFLLVVFVYFSNTIKDYRERFYIIHTLSLLGHNLILLNVTTKLNKI